jgi:ABC transporter DrrB family efflux protein
VWQIDLLRSIVGVQTVASGRVTVLGLAAGSPALGRQIGYATQAPAVYADLTVEENLRYFATVLGVGAEAVDSVLTAVGLDSRRRDRAGRLSGGQTSRVSLAVALLGSPRLLVLDEPTVGLDPVLRDELWVLFNSLAASGATLLVSSHVMDEANRCPQLVLMRDGAVLAHDPPDALAMLRERTSGTLERLMAMPMGKLDLLLGYGLAFGLFAAVQVVMVAMLAIIWLGLTIAGSLALLILLALLDALLGMALGLFVSAFASSGFQAVQFMPLMAAPQIFLCGLFVPRGSMATVLIWVSDVMPLSYAVDAVMTLAAQPDVGGALIRDIVVVAGCVVLALVLSAATLRRQTA